jgi:hypothetical protein
MEDMNYQLAIAQLNDSNKKKYNEAYADLMSQPFDLSQNEFACSPDFYKCRSFLMSFVHDGAAETTPETHFALLFDRTKKEYTIGEVLALCIAAGNPAANYYNFIQFTGGGVDNAVAYQMIRKNLSLLTQAVNEVINTFASSTLKRLLHAQKHGIQVSQSIPFNPGRK